MVSDTEVTTWSGRTQESKNKDVVSLNDFSQFDTLTENLQSALNWCAENKSILLCDGTKLSVAGIVIPDGVVIRGWLYIDWNGQNLVGGEWIATLGSASIDRLTISSSSALINYKFLKTTNDNIKIDNLNLSQSVETLNGNNAFSIYNNNIFIKNFESENIQRPIVAYGDGFFKSGLKIDNIKIKNFVRGVGINYYENVKIGFAKIIGRHSSAKIYPGHNGLLLENVQSAEIDTLIIDGSGEHAVRLSNGSTDSTKNITIKSIYAYRTGGCAFKINSLKGYNVKNIRVDHIYGEDIGDINATSNQEIVRLSHVENISIGDIVSKKIANNSSGSQSLSLNDAKFVTVKNIFAEKNSTVPILFNTSQDGEAGEIKNIFIDNVVHTESCAALFNVSSSSVGIGNIFINNAILGATTTASMYFNSPDILITGMISIDKLKILNNSVTAIKNPPSNNFKYSLDTETFATKNCVGGNVGYTSTYGFKLGVFDPEKSNGVLHISNNVIESKNGNYGSGIQIARPSSERRGAAIVVKQTGEKENNIGLSFLSGSTVIASDKLLENMLLKHNGVLNLPQIKFFESNAAAIASGLSEGDIYSNIDGKLQIVIS
ncbi:hypothetical protein F993_01482 [Acinetobacter proteolyticus]|uniref:Uncharacterized protein n=1 Tax=Acinetobacter proteolyticus TaxID=1776741 RepID=A0A2N0WEZ2_9GAMM|nr:hypothetical protein [Acinetobacter proteolyticus]ENU24166.1 hypothetical protein F993_01482 [Acinetobacter proteolyticus]PKF33440.1 hypothetical protein CW311_11615 [Acinetobacter proteolyticus]